jgi:hypothetical protein
LKAAGRGAGEFMSDLTVFYPAIRGLTRRTRKDLEGSTIKLPLNAFVFMDRMGLQTMFFRLSKNDDPPIYYWNDASKAAKKVFDGLWGFLENELAGHEYISRDRKR